MSEYHKSYPLTIDIDGENVKTLCRFRFYEGYRGNHHTPDEPPFIDLIDVRVEKEERYETTSIICKLSPSKLMWVESMLLEEMLVNND